MSSIQPLGERQLTQLHCYIGNLLLEEPVYHCSQLMVTQKGAFSHAMKEVFGVSGTIDAIQHHGNTDCAVAIKTLEHYGVPAEVASEKLPEIKESMLTYAREHEDEVAEGLELLPGVKEILETLSKSPDAVLGLVTGNLEPIAWMKMKGLGIYDFFSEPKCGGFGSDHMDRGELVKIAAERAAKYFGGGFRKRVHVGDTPADIKAAEYGGAHAIGVCTGVFTREELQVASQGDATILDDLSDLNLFIATCGIRSS